jgi:hypothetical protein
MKPIAQIEDPLERYFAFIKERNEIYLKKINGEPWPWTQDPILQTFRFTEVYRERDRTSLHYQKTVRDHYNQLDLVFPATVLYRWFNRIETCDTFFNQPDFGNMSVFERYIQEGDYQILYECLDKLPTPHVTGAFIINGKPGYTKGEGVLQYFHEFAQSRSYPWEPTWIIWRGNPPPLQEIYDWLECFNGLGSFMRAQIIADLKYLPFLSKASDWWTWAAPGPGSQRGLNRVLSRPAKQPWNKEEWLSEIQRLNRKENLHFEHYLEPFHCQDTQNHCCEFSKYEKVRLGVGRPRQVFRHV